MTTTFNPELDQIMALAQEDLRGARKALRRFAPTVPDVCQAQTTLGLTYFTLEQPRDAVRAFKRAIELDPQDPLPRYHLGAHQSDMGLLPQAEQNLRVCAAAEPENAEYQAALGHTLYKAEKAAEATATLEAAVEAGSEDSDVFASLGYLYYFDERLQDSSDAFSRTIELDPDYAEVYNNRAYLNVLLGNLDEAQSDAAACIEKDESFLRAQYNQAVATWLKGEHDAALEQYETARRKDNDDADLKQHLDDFEEIAKHHPDDESLQDLKVKLAVAQKVSRR